jgi:hypothetical protein
MEREKIGDKGTNQGENLEKWEEEVSVKWEGNRGYTKTK